MINVQLTKHHVKIEKAIEELKLLSVNITDNYILEFITTLTT